MLGGEGHAWQGGMCGRGMYMAGGGGMHGGGHVWQGDVHGRGGMHGGGHVWQGHV